MNTLHTLLTTTLLLTIIFVSCSCGPGTAGDELSRIPILMYHHIVTDTPASDAELHVDCFRQQMQFLYDNGYTTLTLEEFRQYYEGGEFPERTLLITFDDGYRSFLKHAYPILQEFGFTSVLFPVVSYRPGLQRRIVWLDHLSFHEIRRMCSESGLIDIGSHTYDLHHVTDSDRPAVLKQPDETEHEHRERIATDLQASRLILELQTDHEIRALAWPFGIYTPELIDIATDTGFAKLFTTEPGYVTAESPLTALPRFNIARDSDVCFRAVIEGTHR